MQVRSPKVDVNEGDPHTPKRRIYMYMEVIGVGKLSKIVCVMPSTQKVL